MHLLGCGPTHVLSLLIEYGLSEVYTKYWDVGVALRVIPRAVSSLSAGRNLLLDEIIF